jgi:hypothetical protein
MRIVYVDRKTNFFTTTTKLYSLLTMKGEPYEIHYAISTCISSLKNSPFAFFAKQQKSLELQFANIVSS